VRPRIPLRALSTPKSARAVEHSDEEEVAYAKALRCRAAALMNADADRIALTGGASELLGQLPGLLRPRTGSTIVAVATDFPAVTRPWLRYAAERDCVVRFLKDDPSVDLTDSLIQAVGAETGAVAVSFVQYGTGTRIDVPRLRKRTAALGVPLIVDATQAAGLLHVDSKEWGADAVVASG
jgi:selenocysteine lyase/cysteine desulfurase